jgi:hypothetical protein
MKMVSNPDRETKGGRVAATLDLSPRTSLETGIDFQTNEHTLRKASGAAVAGYDSLARSPDMRFFTWGVFGELSHELNAANRLIGGLRVDFSKAEDQRSGRSTSGVTDDDTLKAGFLRWENAFAPTTTLYAGLGHSERAADYWERSKSPAATSMTALGTASTFLVKPEKTTQLDTGAIYAAGPLRASASVFYAKHKDFIQIRQINAFATDALNVDATTYGAEATSATPWAASGRPTAPWPGPTARTTAPTSPCRRSPRWRAASAPATTTRCGAPAPAAPRPGPEALRPGLRQHRRPGHRRIHRLRHRLAQRRLAAEEGHPDLRRGRQPLRQDLRRVHQPQRRHGRRLHPDHPVNEPGRTLWLKANIALN